MSKIREHSSSAGASLPNSTRVATRPWDVLVANAQEHATHGEAEDSLIKGWAELHAGNLLLPYNALLQPVNICCIVRRKIFDQKAVCLLIPFRARTYGNRFLNLS